MPWDMPWFENIKKKSCRYLLQRYLGQFLKEKLTLDRLSVDLYNGTGTVADVSLDVQALNELGEQQNWPLEFVEGYVEHMSVSIPLTSLLSDSSYVNVHGLNVTVQPKQRDEDAASMFESMWSCMTSSMQLAQECLQQEEGLENTRPPPEGLELFANTIDSILSRVKVQFTDSLIRCEHVPKDSNSGVALEIRIKNLEYLDEAGDDPPSGEATDLTSQDHKKTYIVSSFTTKKLYFEGVTFHTDEFPLKSQRISRSVSQSPINSEGKCVPVSNTSKDSDNEQYFMTNSELPNESESEISDNESSKQRNSESQDYTPIIFAKLTGRQEIRLRLKQSEAVNGPKVEIDMTLGSLITFLTPRQLHTLTELGNGLANPDVEDNDSTLGNTRCVQKPMTNSDYKKVEADLQAQLQPLGQLHNQGLQNLHGWSTASIEDSDDDFEPQTTLGGLGDMSDSVLSTASSIESVISTASCQTASSRSSRQTSVQARRKADSDPVSDIWHLELRVASVAILLLHEDLLTPSADADEHPLALSSVRHTAHRAQSFFDNLGLFVITGYGNKDFEKAAPLFVKACPTNHLRLLAAPVQLECTQQSSSHTVAMIGLCTAARFELLECLMPETDSIGVTNSSSNSSTTASNKSNIECVELLCFNLTKSTQHGLGNKPNIMFTFKQSQRTIRYFQGKKRSTRTKLRFHLDNCRTEFDITIVDRINALLNPNPLFSRTTNETISQKTPPYGNLTDNIYLEYKLDIEVLSPECVIKLRFPIPDLRPIHDMQRCPWWKRNVRPDYMTLILGDAYFCFSSYSKQPANRIDLLMNSLDISYTLKDSTSEIALGHVTASKEQIFGEGSKKISLVMHIYPRQSLNGDLDESSGADSEPLSMFDGFLPSKIPTPFSSRRVVHESDTPHSKNPDVDEDHEELVIPGNKQELQEFTDYATRSSRIQVELFFPEVSVQLCSKHLFETIYNRISSDILLWESSAPRAYSGGYDGLYSCADLRESIHPAFSMCKSGIQYESDESGDSEDDGFPYSAYENRRSKYRTPLRGNVPGQSTVSISIMIGQGLLHMFTPVRDSVGNVIPGRQGEFLINVYNSTIFSVSGFRGNLDLGYVCVQAHSAKLYHCGIVETPSGCPPLKEIGSLPSAHLLQTIYPTDACVKLPNSDSGDNNMLTVAIRIQANHEIHHMKVIRVACIINDATLRVNISRNEHTWLTQLQDMFDVLDYPIAGYNPSPVLTELHVHVWSSCIDYRPLQLPIRALITIGSFSISSNLIAQTRTNTLRIITEDCAVLLSNQCKSRNIKISDYVCVMDLGLFELSLRYSDKPRGNNPQMDLRASNNMLHIRTCADSGRALTQLIEYLASDGDFPQSNSITTSIESRPQTNTIVASNEEACTNNLLNVEPVQQICDLSKSQHERVIEGLSEAMEENFASTVNNDDDDQIPAGVKMFFFPDEDEPQSKSETTPLPQVASDLGDTTVVPLPSAPPKRSDTDDEYDIIEKEVEIECLLNAEKSVIWHVIDQAPRWIKNFDAVPFGKSDLLNAPKTFPTPITRYTLCEMNVIWHLYGGNDFSTAAGVPGDSKSKEKQKTVYFASEKCSDLNFKNNSNIMIGGTTAMFTKSDPDKIKFTTKKKLISNVDWKIQGGKERNHDILIEFQLNKVRFRHEIYPDKTREASRQMLLISELEIRDRLATSQINKFLYQYTTEARPKRAQTNMVIIKQLFVRPDPQLKREESILRVSVLPLRLNIDQDTLLFLIAFFNEMSGSACQQGSEKDVFNANAMVQTPSKHNTPTHQPPIMTVANQQPATEDLPTTTLSSSSSPPLEDSLIVAEEAQKLISDNLLILLEDDLLSKPDDIITKQTSEVQSEVKPPVYFRDIRFDSEVPIRIDYHGKRVDMSGPGGALAGLLMGIGQLNCSEIKLRRFRYRHGILGFEKLVSYALHEWLTDIKKNQLPSLLGGVGPMYALVQLFQGIRDLFWLPIEQYQKDGRIVHGLQRGANSFTTSTAMAAIELTSRIIHLIQTTAETAYDMVSPGPSVKRRGHGKKGKRRYHQPQDFREGVVNAYTLVKEGLEETAHTLVQVASHEHEQKGYSGAVGGILRQIPPTVVKPIILATEATNNVLGGMVCELVPEVRREISQKWRNDDY